MPGDAASFMDPLLEAADVWVGVDWFGLSSPPNRDMGNSRLAVLRRRPGEGEGAALRPTEPPIMLDLWLPLECDLAAALLDRRCTSSMSARACFPIPDCSNALWTQST